MGGSTESNEDLVSGRMNQATDNTLIWARRTDSDDGDDFKGSAILFVEVAKDVEDPSDFVDNDWKPQHPIDGIVSSGWSGSNTLIHPSNVGGVGVIGNGGHNQGTGVLGKGGDGGVGGIGVHGIGGSQSEPTWDPTDPPGTGVLGQGGRQATNDLRLPHGAGIVGLAGGIGRPIPSLADTGSVGVFGQGAEAEVETINIDNQNVVVGPMAPGPGVLGRGGVPISLDPHLIAPNVAAGVIGLAGAMPIPPISNTGNTGVYGMGPRGVVGETDTDIGVFGLANKNTGRGGVFQSTRSAQVRLVPQKAIPGERPKLPKDGLGGDLIATVDNVNQCSLWFCVQGAGASPARWAQVLLGAAFDGQG